MPADTGPTPSVFDPAGQHTNPDAKIVAAIERLGQALRVLLWESTKEAQEGSNLSPIQIQILVFLFFHEERLARVGELAREFALTPATTSDAVSALERKGFVEKARLERDRRQVALRLTADGERMARDLAHWAAPVEAEVAAVPEAEKAVVLRVLLSLIAGLQERGVVQSTRMCLTCRYFGREAHPGSPSPHHCHLIGLPLAVLDLRIDCPEHEPAA